MRLQQNSTPPTQEQIKSRVQGWMVVISVTLMAGKFIAFFVTNSVGILTDAMESIVNVTAGVISLYSLYLASKPKDAGHPFGHGKIELISASTEGLLIIIAGCLIIYEGVIRLFNPVMPGSLNIGIAVIAVAGAANYLAGWYSIRMGRRYNSIALMAGGKHLQSDTYSTIGLIAGLILLYVTKVSWIDSALALIFGSIIIATGIGILRRTISDLTDKADNHALEAAMHAIEQGHQPDWIDVHNLKIIKYGSFYYIDCDLTLPWFYNISQGHEAGERLKKTMLTHFSDRVSISIHADSCKEKHCEHCVMQNCEYRRQPCIAPPQFSIKEITMSDELRRENS